MNRKCKIRIGIDGEIYDGIEEWGFYLMDAPTILVPKQREYESESYPETNGENIYPYTTYTAFDYEIKLCGIGTEVDINSKIVDFYKELFEIVLDHNNQPTDLMKAKEIAIYNDETSVKMVGYAKEWDGEKTIVNAEDACGIIFNLTLRVSDPDKCNFKKSE